MRWPLDLLQELTDIVDANTRSESQAPCLELEGLGFSKLLASGKTESKVLIDNLLEGMSRPPSLLLQLSSHIFVKGDGCSHSIMMLTRNYLDVKALSRQLRTNDVSETSHRQSEQCSSERQLNLLFTTSNLTGLQSGLDIPR